MFKDPKEQITALNRLKRNRSCVSLLILTLSYFIFQTIKNILSSTYDKINNALDKYLSNNISVN